MKTLLTAVCLVLIFAGCKKNTVAPYQSEGVLTGYDLGECPTCGGIEITIKNDPTTNPPPFYRINKTLGQLGISENAAFPINVSLNWKRDTTAQGFANFIIVSKIKVNN